MKVHALFAMTLLALLAPATTSSAHADSIPDGAVGLFVGGSTGIGSQGDLGTGLRFGTTANYQPMKDAQLVGVGIQWSAEWKY